jgi:ABC-2 type transport system permease protein
MMRVRAVIRKEFFHILRDPRSLTIIFIMPVVMILIYGHSISYDLKRIDAVLIDFSRTPLSRQLFDSFSRNRYFAVRELPAGRQWSLAAAEKLLRQGTAKEIIIIPADFAHRLSTGRRTSVGIVIDGSESNLANLISQYNEQALGDFNLEYRHLDSLLSIRTQVHFNPEAKSTFFFVPGLMAVLMLMISAMLTSLSMSRERETGSIELLFISPLRAGEIVVGKAVPYILISLIAGGLILLFARFWFQIPIRGSMLVLFCFALIYIVCGLSLGILISTVASSQRVAMIAALLVTMLPSFLLSGFIFPLDSLPPLLRAVSAFVPATYFLRIIRGVILKGAGLQHFLFEGGMLILLSGVLLIAAARKFSRQREALR